MSELAWQRFGPYEFVTTDGAFRVLKRIHKNTQFKYELSRCTRWRIYKNIGEYETFAHAQAAALDFAEA